MSDTAPFRWIKNNIGVCIAIISLISVQLIVYGNLPRRVDMLEANQNEQQKSLNEIEKNQSAILATMLSLSEQMKRLIEIHTK